MGRGSTTRFLAIVVCALAVVSTLPALPAEAAGLEPGARSNLVTHLQHRLADIGFYRGAIDGEYGPQTSQAVMAFHKHLGLDRDFAWQSQDWQFLDRFEPIEHAGEPMVMVDLDRQVLYLHGADGTVSAIPVSSGNGERYVGRGGRIVAARTPTGDFTFRRHVAGMRMSYLGAMWRPWYFYGGYAIHGSSSVPGYPASHGCIRVPNWEADWLENQLWLGMRVSVRRGGPVTPPVYAPPPPMDREAILERVV